MVRHAVLFPGQGSQFVGMADPWVGHPDAAAVLEETSEALGHDVVAGCHDEDKLATTEFVQPALLACDVAAFATLRAEGLDDIAGVAGHSLGEFASVVAAGAIELRDAIELVIVRGAAMQRAGEERPGTMSALLGVGTDDAEQLCAEVRDDDVLVVANQNSPAQVVASGSIAAIERLEALAKGRRVRAVRLRVAGAFHSELMRPAVEPVLEVLDRIDVRDPAIPISENVSGDLVRDATTLRDLLGRQVVSPVRWETGIHALVAAGTTTFLEAGPGDVLTKLMRRIDPGRRAVAVGSPQAARQALPSDR